MLDCLLVDPSTDGILLYVETVRDARRFISALRAAARTKPVIVLKAGRSHDAPDDVAQGPFLPRADAERAVAMVTATFVEVLAPIPESGADGAARATT